MSSRAVLCITLLAMAAPAAALDWSDFALASDRSKDALLLDVMNGSDLATAVGICSGVGLRADPFAGDIIESLAASRMEPRAEILLRTLLKGLLDPGRTDPPLPVRVTANQQALQVLYDSFPSFQDPQLVAALVLLLPDAPEFSPSAPLMAAARRIQDRLDEGKGMLDAQETALAMEVLGAARRLGGADFLDFCASVVHISLDGGLVSAARATAAVLAPGPTR
jgi:hypothetical protein